MSARLSCVVPLPQGFRTDEFLAFHRRDPQELSERVGEASLHKGLDWRGAPAQLEIRIGPRQADVALDIDAQPGQAHAGVRGRNDLEAMVHRMLGLTQAVDAFEQRHRDHPLLGRLIAARPGLRVPLATTPFEALTWAITGQQISVAVAVSLRRKLILAAGVRHSDGLLCHPDAVRIAGLGEDTLRAAGFSTAKTATLLAVSRLVADGTLALDAWLRTLAVDRIREGLLAVRGIGPWTVDYTLLRGFGWLDGSLHGDVAVRGSLQSLLAEPDRIGEKRTQQWLAQFSPWRALVAAHLWAARSAAAAY